MPAKNKVGRPKTQIDLSEAEKLGMLQCTYNECAAWLDIPEGTLKNHKEFTTAFKKGLEKGKLSLRRSQFKMAEKSATMSIWLGKQYLGQRDERPNEAIDVPTLSEIADAIRESDTECQSASKQDSIKPIDNKQL